MLKSKELRHGYTHGLPTQSPLTRQAVAFHQPWPHGWNERRISRVSWNECPAAHRGGWLTCDKVLVRPEEASGGGGDMALLSTPVPLACNGGVGGGGLMPNPCPKTPRPHRLQGARLVDKGEMNVRI